MQTCADAGTSRSGARGLHSSDQQDRGSLGSSRTGCVRNRVRTAAHSRSLTCDNGPPGGISGSTGGRSACCRGLQREVGRARERLGSAPERQLADRCVLQQRDRLGPLFARRSTHQRGVRRRAALLERQRRGVPPVGGVQPRGRGVRRRRGDRGLPQRGDLADERVAAARGAPRTPSAARCRGRPRPTARCASRAGRRRRPRRARPPAWSAGPRARSRPRGPHADSAGSTARCWRHRGRHRGQQPGQRAALGAAGGVDERRVQGALAAADQARSAAARRAARTGGARSRRARPRAPRRGPGARAGAPSRTGGPRRVAARWTSTASAATSAAATSSTSASSGVWSGAWALGASAAPSVLAAGGGAGAAVRSGGAQVVAAVAAASSTQRRRRRPRRETVRRRTRRASGTA